jgi:diguanylate cyclase (GGDEF)-like protein
MLHRDGSYRWMSCRGVVRRDSAGQAVHVYASHADVTAHVASDPLTGLPTRLLFLYRLTRPIERAARYPGFHFAVVCVDLDRQGPAAAPVERPTCDPLLSAAARRLETCLRTREMPPTLRNNDLVARLQGDQFAILLDGLKEIGHATIAAERILAEVRAPYALAGREVRLAASVGIALSATG